MARILIGNVWDIPGLSKQFAPVGYGLGRDAVYTEDFDTTLKNGWYYGTLGTVNAPNGFTVNCTCFVVARTPNQITQYFFDPTNGCVLQRYTTDGGVTWTEEWVNPPMMAGVEYRTTERWNGKPVYTSLVDCGVCASPHKDVTTNFSCTSIIRHYGRIGGQSIPMINGTLDNQWTAWANAINLSGYVRVTIYNGSSLDGESAEVQVWYTKD